MEDLPTDVWGGEKKSSGATGIDMPTTTTASKPVTTGMGDPKSYYQQGMQAIGDMATGNSPIYKNIENRATQGFGGQAIAAMGAAKQGASQTGYTPEGIGSIERSTATALEGQRSKMLGEVANQKQQLATTAANQLVIGGLSGMGEVRAERAQTFTEGQYADTKKQSDWERLLQTYDPSTPEGLKSLQTGYTSLFGGEAPDLNAITDQRNYLKTKQQQDIALGGIGVESAGQGLKDQQQASIMSRIASGYSVERINQELGTDLTPEEYAQMRTNTDTYFTSKGIEMNEASLYGYTYNSDTGEVVTDPDEIAALGDKAVRITGSLGLAKDQFDLTKETFAEQKKELWGWDEVDKEGNKILGKDGKPIHHAGKYDMLTDENKRAADSMYGYDVKDANGNIITDKEGNPIHVRGTLELANSADLINAQGMNLQEAQIKGCLIKDDQGNEVWSKGSIQIAAEKAGLEVSSLYGYAYNKNTGEIVTNPTERSRLKAAGLLEEVDGALVLAGKRFGIEKGTYEMQYAEMFGKNVDGTQIINPDGTPASGRIQIMNSENQRAAYQLYGGPAVDVNGDPILDDNGNQMKIPGTLEIMRDELAIKKQGMTIEEAQFFGYDRVDEDGNKILGEDGKPIHIDGNLEIENRKMDILEEEYQTQLDNEKGKKLADYFATMSVTAGYDWKSDDQASQFLQDYWETIPGNEGTTVDEDWAQRQYSATTISQSDAALTKLEGEQWYKDLVKSDPETAEQVKTVAKMAAYLSVTQGATPVYDTDGTVIGLKDSEGNIFYSIGTSSTVEQERTAGELYVANGKIFKAGTNNGSVQVDMPEDVWSADANDIISLGQKNNPYYNDIIKTRADQIISGVKPINTKISDEALLEEIEKRSVDFEPQTGTTTEKKGAQSSKKGIIKNAPEIDSVIKYNGNIYIVKSAPVMMSDMTQHFQIYDISTGKLMDARAWTNNELNIQDAASKNVTQLQNIEGNSILDNSSWIQP